MRFASLLLDTYLGPSILNLTCITQGFPERKLYPNSSSYVKRQSTVEKNINLNVGFTVTHTEYNPETPMNIDGR